MNLKNVWYPDNRTVSDKTNGKFTVIDDIAKIEFGGEGYSVSAIARDIEISSEKAIKLFCDIDNNNLNYDLLAVWKKDDETIAEEYINDFPLLVPPENVNILTFTVLVYSDKKGSITIKPPVKEEKEIEEKKKFKAAAISPYYHFWSDNYERSFEDNLNESLYKIDSVYKEAKPDLIVLTENFYSRWAFKQPLSEGLITVDSEPIKIMQKKAKELSVFIAFSFAELDYDGTRYNGALLIDRNGEIIAHYRKTHLTISEKRAGLKHGECPVVVETELGKIGFAICWDLFFPEFVKTLADMGAEVIINPSAGYNEAMNTIRAKDNGVYIITAGPVGTGTAIIDPAGNHHGNPEVTGSAIAEIDLNKKFYQRGLSAVSSAEWKNLYPYENRKSIYKN